MERTQVSVSKKSILPLFAVLCGLVLCLGMVQRLRDPVYPSTMDDYLYLASGILMTLAGLFGMRIFPWTCIIPVVVYLFVGLLTPTTVHYYQIIILVPLLLLLIGRYPKWLVWILKGLAIIAVCVPFAMAFTTLQDELLSLQLQGYLTEGIEKTKWTHFLMIEASFYVGTLFMILSLRWLPEQPENDDDWNGDTDAYDTAKLPMQQGYDERYDRPNAGYPQNGYGHLPPQNRNSYPQNRKNENHLS